MKTKTFLNLCWALPAAWVVALLLVPGFSDAVEQVILVFLATTAG
jgi:hypothetical protein